VKRSFPANSKAAKDREVEAQRILAILRKWGIDTLRQLAALDRDELAARLGPAAVRLWERANGKTTRLLKLIQPPESFNESFEFENEIETAEPLLFMLRRFLQQLDLRLSALYLVAKELRLRITFADKNFYEHRFKIPEPTNKIDILFRMLHTHLENFKSNSPIIAVLLEAEPIKPSAQQFGLFETALRDPGRLYETLARLVGLLGAARVGTPVLEETHRPDSFRIEPFEWKLNDAIEAKPLPSMALRKFRPASSATVFLSEKIPAHIQSAKVDGKVQDQRGPYFASGNWWDEKAWARAEWDLQLDGDVLCRSYQGGDGAWQIDGIYD
jgi:protein ImuB